jgi:beta-glucosidase
MTTMPVKSIRVYVLTAFLFSFGSATARQPGIERRIDSLLTLMTLEEKCGQLCQVNAAWTKERGPYLGDEDAAALRKGLVGSVLNLYGAKAVAEAERIAVTESRLRIPLLMGLDVIHGYRTIFPVPIAEASTWDPRLAELSAHTAASEASAAGIQWTFAPMVDIARDPRWGRIVEGSGEDPYLGSVMAAARVRGFQGTDLTDPASIMACAKHFAAYGAAEGGRDYNVADISERTLREIYLPPFHAAVEAGAGSLMSSFNEISGVPSSANRFILTDILRHEWNFDGFVVSDWTAIEELQPHGVAASRSDAGALAVNAGVDMDMVSGIYQKELPALVREGRVRIETVNEAVRRVLRAKFRLGLFTDATRGATPERESASLLTEEHLHSALEVARKSIVLLKNEASLLPLSARLHTIAVIGPLADDKDDPLGPWRGNGKPENTVTVLEGIREKAPPGTRVTFAKGCGIDTLSTRLLEEALGAAMEADVSIAVLGESAEMSGEASSRSSIGLPEAQKELLMKLHETGKPIVLVLMNGRPLTIAWEAESIPAILETWFLGTETGHAIADVLFGAVNPSGKLPVSFPRSIGQIPLYYNHKNTGRPRLDEKEKYTSRYLDSPNTPLYPFGYGLSYTTFALSNLTLSRPAVGLSDSLEVTVTLANTGRVDGEEVVQLYTRQVTASVTRPVEELRAFRRVQLKAGERTELRFVLHPDQLSFYNLKMVRVTEPDEFRVYVGPNSRDVIEGKFQLTGK